MLSAWKTLCEFLCRLVRAIDGSIPQNGHNYALAIVERMGLLEAGGMIHVGPVHYNTLEEIEKIGAVLEKFAS
jgi:selenocysteine lyase/cysteine desulfurase